MVSDSTISARETASVPENGIIRLSSPSPCIDWYRFYGIIRNLKKFRLFPVRKRLAIGDLITLFFFKNYLLSTEQKQKQSASVRSCSPLSSVCCSCAFGNVIGTKSFTMEIGLINFTKILVYTIKQKN